LNLRDQLVTLTAERDELQSCLDEALRELEAVDIELQQQNSPKAEMVLEPLQHLYRWVRERRPGSSDDESAAAPGDLAGLVAALRQELQVQQQQQSTTTTSRSNSRSNSPTEETSRAREQDLHDQLQQYRTELRTRDENNSELRASLKEAVELIKPLQDTVAEAEEEKQQLRQKLLQLQQAQHAGASAQEMKRIQQELSNKNEEISHLKDEIQSLQAEVTKARIAATTQLSNIHRVKSDEDGGNGDGNSRGLTKVREELRAKREQEKVLKTMLTDTRQRFQALHAQHAMAEAENSVLQGQLRDVVGTTTTASAPGEIQDLQKELDARETRLREMESELQARRSEVDQKNAELQDAASELERAKAAQRQGDNHEQFSIMSQRVKELEEKVNRTTKELRERKESERTLNKSLRDALRLLKPLQSHLEESEKEKASILEELNELRRSAGNAGADRSLSFDSATLNHLKETVRQLEKENSQMQDAMDTMSQNLNISNLSSATNGATVNKAELRLREEVVALRSRIEVTQKRLEDAYVENHTLVEALTKQDDIQKAMDKEISTLRGELGNAKFIATSALVKVEELTMANVERLSMSGASQDIDHDAMFTEKARQFERELISAEQQAQLPKTVPYRLT
jgi:chromosome segregation ATPase